MRTNITEELMDSNSIKNLGLKKDTVEDILSIYNNIIITKLLDNGYIELNNGMIIEVVQLLDRVHVLRGVSYNSNRKYKLKLTMTDDLYKKIEEYYNRLQEEIL